MQKSRYENRITHTKATGVVLSKHNLIFVARWTNGDLMHRGVRLEITTPLGRRTAREGDLVVKNEMGQVFIANKKFRKLYKNLTLEAIGLPLAA